MSDPMRALIEQVRDENNRRFSSIDKSIEKIAATLERFITIEQMTSNQATMLTQHGTNIYNLTERLTEVESTLAVVNSRKAFAEKIYVGSLVASFAIIGGLILQLIGA